MEDLKKEDLDDTTTDDDEEECELVESKINPESNVEGPSLTISTLSSDTSGSSTSISNNKK